MHGTYFHECPKCGNEMEVFVSDAEVDIPTACDSCWYKFTETERENICSKALEDVLSSAIDRDHDQAKDRQHDQG